MKNLAFSLASILAISAVANPAISYTSISQPNRKAVKIDYTLDEPAVVMINIQTNATGDAWFSIGAEETANVKGDVGAGATNTWSDVGVGFLVPAGSHSFVWTPGDSWIASHPDRYNARAEIKAWPVTAPPDYMVVDLRSSGELAGAPRIRYFESAEKVPGGVSARKYKTDYLLMRRIHAEGALYRMGSPSGEVGKSSNTDIDETIFNVTLTNDFYLGVYELTRMQCVEKIGIGDKNAGNEDRFTGKEAVPVGGDNGACAVNYGDFRGTTYSWPADGHLVTDNSALGKLRTLTGIDFDLPTEAQWEFACRAGTDTALYTGENLTDPTTSANLDAIAWYKGNSGSTAHEVGLKQPNGFGLYDMLGNSAEFCLDWCNGTSRSSATVTEPVGPNSGSYKVLKGGAYSKDAWMERAAQRQKWVSTSNRFGDCGFRLWAPAIAK